MASVENKWLFPSHSLEVNATINRDLSTELEQGHKVEICQEALCMILREVETITVDLRA